MHLELKKVGDFFQTNLRGYIRAAKKAEITLHILASGFHDQTITLSTSSVGPIAEKTIISLSLYAIKESELVCLKFPVNLNAPLSKDDILQRIEEQFVGGNSTAISDMDQDFSVYKGEDYLVDENLLTVEIDEIITFFRSRFLIDAPRKLLYSAMISRGFSFQCFADESSGIQFTAKSYYSVQADLRTRLSQFHYEYSGATLRGLRLSPIRRHLGAYWKAKPMESDIDDYNGSVIFGFLALGKLAEAGLIAMKNDNDLLWHWLKKTGEVEGGKLAGLECRSESEDGDISGFLDESFSSWMYPAGQEKLSLGEVLMGENDFNGALYIHDLKAFIRQDRIRIITISTNLYVSRRRKPRFVEKVFEIKLTGELLVNAKASAEVVPIMRSGGRKSLMVPEYICVEDLNIKVRSLARVV
ncbi:MAG: hypothetical protein HQL32_05605 [Planctomycetes bacterium]|nr:hypothetical protein [Planctomycetota bacterium]